MAESKDKHRARREPGPMDDRGPVMRTASRPKAKRGLPHRRGVRGDIGASSEEPADNKAVAEQNPDDEGFRISYLACGAPE